MLKHEDAWEFLSRMHGPIQIRHTIAFGDWKGVTPRLELGRDDTSYFSPKKNLIHIGVYGLVDMLRPQTEAELWAAFEYVVQHEEQHVRSTVSHVYGGGIEQGCYRVMEFISAQVESTPRVFRKESDYEYFANQVLPSLGVYLNWDALREYIGRIANSLEDGRIERIRAQKRPGFALSRLAHRGRVWELSGEIEPFPTWQEVDASPMNKVRIMTNQILSLATCQVYQKGFSPAYAGTPLMSEVVALMPHIAGAVSAGKTKGTARGTEAIAECMAPYLYKACKASGQGGGGNGNSGGIGNGSGSGGGSGREQSEIAKALEDLLDALGRGNGQRGLADLMGDLEGGTLSAQTEEGDAGGTMTAFPGADLDLGKEQAAKAQNSAGQSDQSDACEGDQADDAANTAGKAAEQGGQTGTQGGKSAKPYIPDKPIGGKTVTAGAAPTGENDEQVILDAMKAAAERICAEAGADIDNINSAQTGIRRFKGDVQDNTDKPVSSKEVAALCSTAFREYRRQYRLDQKLPPPVDARGRTMLRKNQQYFRSLSTPTRRYLDSGSVDAGRIYGLSFGDTEIFSKKGMDKKFDGCAYILIDNSSSMSGNKRIEACKAAAVIEESFRGLIPIKIIAYDSRGGVNHEVIKGFEERQRLNCCWNFACHGRYGGGTPTGDSVAVATKELLGRPERKRLLVVLTDGWPDNAKKTKDAISKARKSGVSVFGIRFEEGCVADDAETFRDLFSGKDIVCCELGDVDRELSALFKKFAHS